MARTFFYYQSIRRSIVNFLKIFDDIRVAKYDSDGNITKSIEVPVKFSPKQKWYSWLNDRKHEKRYPMIGVELTSVNYDQQRTSGQFEKIDIVLGEDSKTYTQMIKPYNLGFTVRIASEYMKEIDQINEQILPYFNPNMYRNIEINELNINWDMKVTLEDASINVDSDISEDMDRVVEWSHTYNAKTNLLLPTGSIGYVKKIVNKFYLTEFAWDSINTLTDMPSGTGSQDEELLILGSKEDEVVLAEYMRFGQEQ